MEFATALAYEGLAVVCENPSSLMHALAGRHEKAPERVSKSRLALVEALQSYLSSLENQN